MKVPKGCRTPNVYYLMANQSNMTDAQVPLQLTETNYTFREALSSTEYRIQVSGVNDIHGMKGNWTELLYRTAAYGECNKHGVVTWRRIYVTPACCLHHGRQYPHFTHTTVDSIHTAVDSVHIAVDSTHIAVDSSRAIVNSASNTIPDSGEICLTSLIL